MILIKDELLIRPSDIFSIRKNIKEEKIKINLFSSKVKFLPCIITTAKGYYTTYYDSIEERDKDFKRITRELEGEK